MSNGEFLRRHDWGIRPGRSVTARHSASATVVVLTALPVEYQAMRSRLDELRRITHGSGTGFEIGSVRGTSAEVVLGRIGEGNTAAAVAAGQAIATYRPQVLLVVGVAGALNREIDLGDVVVATRVYAVHGGREENGRFYARPRAFEAGYRPLNTAVRIDAGQTWQVADPDGSRVGFRVHFKPVACAETVLDASSGSLVNQIREHYNDAAAIETESAGAAQAAHAAEVPMLTVRGISDRADGRKQAADAAGWQSVAAAHAAEVAVAVLRECAATEPRIATRLGGRTLLDAPAIARNTLPPDTAAFTGRSEELSRITAQARATSRASRIVAINAFDGMPGVGKTALAVHLAHHLTNRFPDMQLFIDLHAHSETQPPADPVVLLTELLVGDGLDSRMLPSTIDGLCALWRARTFRRRMLLVLDDAASGTQIAPLLPGVGSCLVLVTSRQHLDDLPYAIDQSTLDVLPRTEAITLFQRLAPHATRQNEEAIAEVVEAAGRLPLAIALYAAQYRKHSAWTLGDLAHEARTTGIALAAERSTVATAFDSSYRSLGASRQRFFRLLGLHMGADLDLYAAAALTDTSLGEAKQHLDALLGARLLTETAYHRYGMHDLIRNYARALAGTDLRPGRNAAIDRLLHYYAYTARTASALIARFSRPEQNDPAPAQTPSLPNPDTARTWLRAERSNLNAAFAYARAHTLDRHTIALASGLAEILRSDGPWTHALEIHQAAADASGRAGNPGAHANALSELGRLQYLTGHHREAVDAFSRALEIHHRLGNQLGQAIIRTEVGRARSMAGDFSAAVNALASARNIYRAVGQRKSEANALSDLGRIRHLAGDLPRADETHTRALHIYHELGDHVGEAATLTNLGHVRYLAKDFPRADKAHARALDIYRALGQCNGEAYVLAGLWRIRSLAGDFPHTANAHTRALEIYRALGDRSSEAQALNHYAAALAGTGQHTRALALYQQALAMNRELNRSADEAISLEGITQYHRTKDEGPTGR